MTVSYTHLDVYKRQHMNWAGDSKIKPENMNKLGIKESHEYDKRFYNMTVGRMNAEQRKVWDATYDKMNEEFIKNYPKMNDTDKMKWRYQRYMQDYLGCIASVDEGVGTVSYTHLDVYKRQQLRHAADFGRHADATAALPGRHLRRKSRFPTAAIAGIGGRTLV